MRDLIKTITNYTPGSSPFQRNFYKKELENADKSTPNGIVRDQLKAFYTNQLEWVRSNPKNHDIAENMNRLIVYINKANDNKGKINDALSPSDTSSEDFLALKEAFNSECINFKKKLIKETIQAVIDLNHYGNEGGPDYGKTITMECESYLLQMSSEDRTIFEEYLHDHIKACDGCFRLAKGSGFHVSREWVVKF